MEFSISSSTKIALEKTWDVIIFDSIGSTNTYAKENLSRWDSPTLLLAKHQTHGRGRGQNHWDDVGSEKQFLGSFVLPMVASSHQPAVDPRWTMALGYFVYDSLGSTWPKLKFSIKAPNDIFLDEKKLGGLLVEASQLGQTTYLILGLGLNVLAHPQELQGVATHLPTINEKDWNEFIGKLGCHLENFEKFVSQPQWLAIISSKLKIALNLNPHHRINPVQNILENGSLELSRGTVNWLEL